MIVSAALVQFLIQKCCCTNSQLYCFFLINLTLIQHFEASTLNCVLVAPAPGGVLVRHSLVKLNVWVPFVLNALGLSRDWTQSCCVIFISFSSKFCIKLRVTSRVPGLGSNASLRDSNLKCKHKRSVQQQFHVENWTGALDTAFFYGEWHM